MNNNVATLEQFAPVTFRFYRHALAILQSAHVPFLVGGAYAFDFYTGIARHTKDFDIFLRQAHLEPALDAFQKAGYKAELVFTHWLAKVYHADDFVDLIFSSGNGLCPVDDDWFKHSIAAQSLGAPVHLLPVEEMIWQKAFVMERERFDGADVLHLINRQGNQINWERLLKRFGPQWPVLHAHLILYEFVYPEESAVIQPVLEQLRGRKPESLPSAEAARTCYGTLFSRIQYLTDLEEWGYRDARHPPTGTMLQEQIVAWTNAGR